jgi:hypothetical protein
MKQTTINRFREWAKHHGDDEQFSAGTETWTKHEFAVKFLGEKPKKLAKPINIDTKVEVNADVERTFETRHTEESGD